MPIWGRSFCGGGSGVAALALALATGVLVPAAGCGGGGGEPAGFSPEVQKQNQALISGGYRDAVLANHKAQKAAKAAAKKGP